MSGLRGVQVATSSRSRRGLLHLQFLDAAVAVGGGVGLACLARSGSRLLGAEVGRLPRALADETYVGRKTLTRGEGDLPLDCVRFELAVVAFKLEWCPCSCEERFAVEVEF